MQLARRDWILIILVSLLLVVFAAWQIGPAQEFDWKFDEGVDVSKAALVLQGHRLYTDMWSDHAPLFTVALAGSFALFGQEVLVARLLVLACSLLGLASLAILSRLALKGWYTVIPVVLMMLLPHYNHLSRIVLIGLPAISIGIAALGTGALYYARRQRGWLILAATLFAASLLIKPITAPMFPALCALIWLAPDPARTRHRSWQDLGIMVLVLIGLGALSVAIWGLAFVRQVVGVLFEARGTQGSAWPANPIAIAEYLQDDKYGLSHLAVVALAVVGAGALALNRAWHWLSVIGLWLGGVLLALLWQTPLRSHELVLVMPPLAILAGAGIKAALDGLLAWRSSCGTQRLVTLVACAGLLYQLVGLPAAVDANIALRQESILPRDKTPTRQDAIRFLRDHTAGGSIVLTDDPMLTFLAERNMIPELVVSSYRRIEAGMLDPAEIIRLAQQAQPTAVALWRGSLSRIEGFDAWVDANYVLARVYEDDQRIYLPRPAETAWVSQTARFQEGLTFLGSSLGSPSVDAGETLTMTLFWQLERATTEDYTMFVHLLDQGGRRLAGVDMQPLDGEFKTSAWQPGQMIAQQVTLSVPLSAEPGAQLLSVGMYDYEKNRLHMVDGAGKPLDDGQVILALMPVVRLPANYAIPAMQHAYDASLGATIELLGYDAPEDLKTSDRELPLTLYWRCVAPMPTNYKVFAHLLDAQDEIAVQLDQQPGAGQFPTSGWRSGEIVTDICTIPLAEGLPAGAYRLRLGIYDGDSSARLPVVDQERGTTSDHLVIEPFVLVAP